MQPIIFLLFLSFFSGNDAGAAPISATDLQQAICPLNTEKLEEIFPTPADSHGHAKPVSISFEERERRLGPCRRVEGQGENRFTLHYDGARMSLQILSTGNDDESRALRFGRPLFSGDTLDRAWADLRGAAPFSSILVQKNGADVFARKEDEPLSVDLSFGLVLLDAVRGLGLNGDTPLPLNVERIPWSGLIGQWPVGTLVTVDNALALMFVHRDRTAFDLLAGRLGTGTLSNAWGQPVLLQSTYARYLGLSAKQRKAVGKIGEPGFAAAVRGYGEEVDQLPSAAPAGTGWRATTRELCRLLQSRRREAILRRSVALADLPGWTTSSVEGWGPGAAQLTYGLRRPDKKDWYCVSITANFKGAVKEDRVLEAMERVAALLK